MTGKFQWEASLEIAATSQRVWEIVDDISLIPQYHPEVGRVDLLSGQKQRAQGVKYQCTILEGRKGSCVEEVVEYVPGRKMSTTFSRDSWGMSNMFAEFVVDTTVIPYGPSSTILRFAAYYKPLGFRMWFLNQIVVRRVMRRRSILVMKGIKRLAENIMV